MQPSVRKVKKTEEKSTKIKEKSSKDDSPITIKNTQDENLKKPRYNLSSRKHLAQTSTAADVFSQPKNKLIASVTASRNAKYSPTKGVNSSASNSSQISLKSTEKIPKTQTTSRIKKEYEKKTNSITARKNITPRIGKDLPLMNVTVNSPPAKKKIEFEKEKRLAKEIEKGERERKKTRTLQEDEVKVLTPETVDNNEQMKHLSSKLIAKPKAFYVDLDGPKNTKDLPVQADAAKPETQSKLSEDEVSYEDDFESYESDFDSYHTNSSRADDSEQMSDGDDQISGNPDKSPDNRSNEDKNKREGKDEENMLDSGSFELHDAQKSTNKSKPTAMELISEDPVGVDMKTSLTDEGFQDMSSSSAVSSMKIITHVDVLDRPLFIDFKKSKETKRKRMNFERLQQRAKDLLSMITLHEMSYTLFEMKPIPYDLYMATFGRNNYTQSGVQTFDDGIAEEVQTDEVFHNNKWTQFPVEFSKNDVCLSKRSDSNKKPNNDEDYLKKFTFLLSSKDVDVKQQKHIDNDYKANPLRIYFEQKDGVGMDTMLSFERYEAKLKNTDHNANKLGKFLKKVEGRVSNILSSNTGNTALLDLKTTSKLPSSKGYKTLEYKNLAELKFLNNRKVSDIIFSDTKNNLLMTVHEKNTKNVSMEKCLICLWDLSIASRRPMKILIAIDNLILSRFRGDTDGVFVSALEDCSIHLWDLSEKPSIMTSLSIDLPPTPVQFDTSRMTQTEIDREWNLKNSRLDHDKEVTSHLLRACAYTSSAVNLQSTDNIDSVVGLELLGNDTQTNSQDGGRKIVGQVCSLQRLGILTLWLIIQEKANPPERDIGKAYWSKMKLEKKQTISLHEFIDSSITNFDISDADNSFNLSAAKRRLASKKKKSKFENSRPFSAAGDKNEKVLPVNWESNLLCTDLKVIKLNRKNNYLVAKNCGEVLCCNRVAADVKVQRFCITKDKSSITRLCVSPHGLPYFLAASEAGTLHLCSLNETRVLLTLDSRNSVPRAETSEQLTERSVGDHRGRYVGTVSHRNAPAPPAHYSDGDNDQVSMSALTWCVDDPCRMFTLQRHVGSLTAWNLSASDIYATTTDTDVATACASADGVFAILTPDGEIQIHRLFNDQRNIECLDLFKKYVEIL